MKLTVQISNQSITLDIDLNDRIKLLKYLIRKGKGIEMRNQMLVFGGELLKDRLKLNDYEKIVDGSIIRMVLADNYYCEAETSNDIKVNVKLYDERARSI